jgi:hypothetical protein
MRVEQFAAPGDIEPAALVDAAFFDLAEGAEPAALVRCLIERVDLPPAEAQDIVGQQNGRLQALMLSIAERLESQHEVGDIVDDLVGRDWPGPLALGFVARVRDELRKLAQTAAGRDQLMAAARRRMLFGFALFGGGLAVSWFTQYEAARNGGGYAVIAWGAVLYGIALFGIGAYRWLRYRVG